MTHAPRFPSEEDSSIVSSPPARVVEPERGPEAPVPEDNQPDHHPAHEPDEPDLKRVTAARDTVPPEPTAPHDENRNVLLDVVELVGVAVVTAVGIALGITKIVARRLHDLIT